MQAGKNDIHQYRRKLECAERTLSRENFAEEDKELIRSFAEHLKARDLNPGRITKYIFHLIVMRRSLNCNFKEADRKAIEKLMVWLNSQTYKPGTRADMKGSLKRFYRWLRFGNSDKDQPYPEEVAWLKVNLKRSEIEEPEILNDEEVTKMIGAATNLRDKAIIAVAYEGGFRIGEMLNVRIGDVSFNEHGARVKVKGKTGERTVLLITSSPLLSRYLDEHPDKNNHEAPLWIHYGMVNRFGILSYGAACKILKEIAARAGIKKRVHPPYIQAWSSYKGCKVPYRISIEC